MLSDHRQMLGPGIAREGDRVVVRLVTQKTGFSKDG